LSDKPVNKWLVAFSVAIGSLMASIDSSIVNVAMPHIRGSIGATIEEITWVSTAYIIAMVLVMPLTGLLGALFGQKRLYLASMVLFVFGSVLCGLGRSLPTLVLYRVIQGLGAGSLQPSQQAILRQTFPPEEQGMAMAVFSMVIMVGPAVGPSIGGWITDNFSWPWIFYINLPVGIFGTFMTWKFVHDSADVQEANRARAVVLRRNMDWAGIALMTVAIGALQYFLEEGPEKDWLESTQITVCGVVAAVALAAFVIRELTFPHPVINLRLFKDRTFTSGTIIGGIMFGVLMGSMFLLPLFMQELLGFDATQSGVTLMPRTLAMLAVTPFVGKIYNKVQPAFVIAFGVLLFIIGSLQLSRITLQSGSSDIIFPLMITGVGLSCLFVPLTTAALTNTPRADLADAAGLSSFVRQIGGSVGLTIFATLLTRSAVQAKAAVSWHITALRPEVARQVNGMLASLAGRGIVGPAAESIAVRALAGKAALQGMVMAFERSFMLQGLAFLAVLPLLLFLKVNRSQQPVHVEISLE
jgi:DHA2 family multidrug resistance protein